MLLPKNAEYALRATSCIAALSDGETVSAGKLSALADVPQAYLSKILRSLVTAGLLTSKPGRTGGFKLARPAIDISFRMVFEAVGHEHSDACVFGAATCDPGKPCPLHDAWRAQIDSWLTWADANNLHMAPPGLQSAGA